MPSSDDPPPMAAGAQAPQDTPTPGRAVDRVDTRDATDPRGVIAESYRIDGIGAADCRSIFLDWVLSTDMPSAGPASAIGTLLARHGAEHPDHPMTAVLRAGLQDAPQRGRRGGRAARYGPSAPG